MHYHAPVKALNKLWLVDAAHELDGVPQRMHEAGQAIILAAGIHRY